MKTNNNNNNVAILEKNDMIAVLAVSAGRTDADHSEPSVFGRFDPREYPPVTVALYSDFPAAESWFFKSVRTSLKNGWRQVYFGQRNWG